MTFLIFLLLLGIGYMLWRIMDQLPDVVFRLSEIQRDIAEIRRSLQEQQAGGGEAGTSGAASASSAAASSTPGGAGAPGET